LFFSPFGVFAPGKGCVKMGNLICAASFIQQTFDSRENYIVIGLCGKTGAGCTTAAKLLHTPYEQLHMSQYQERGTSFDAAYEQREYQILHRFAERHWVPFEIIKSSALLTGHVLQYAPELLADFLSSTVQTQTVSGCGGDFLPLCQRFFQRAMYLDLSPYADSDGKMNVEHLFSAVANAPSAGRNILDALRRHNEAYPEETAFQDAAEVGGIMLSRIPNTGWVRISNTELYRLFTLFCRRHKDKKTLDNPILCFVLKEYIYYYLPKWSAALWNEVDRLHQISSIVKQMLGINLRMFREPYNIDGMELKNDGYTIIAEDINFSIKLLRNYHHLAGELRNEVLHTRIAIDSIKNPFESRYLSDRYSNYYLFGIYTQEENRINRYQTSQKNLGQLLALDALEQPLELKKRLQQLDAEDGQDTVDTLSGYALRWLCNYEKRYASVQLRTLFPFILQNISSCFETADVFFNNDNKPFSLEANLVRYVCLVMHPGLLLPTPVERMMQMAYIAKLNSGCLSRQVGAVITDAQYHLLSVGWNQQPEGQFPCAYRDIDSLCSPGDEGTCKLMYSDFELEDGFRDTLRSVRQSNEQGKRESGTLTHYCFKDVYNAMAGTRDFIYTRSMHAEETAFLNLGSKVDAAKGGYLFTTSSPCISCAKQAMQMQIAKIYYIEQYPGIQLKHVLSSTSRCPEMELPTGVIGKAYVQLYTPIMPLKDEDELWTGWKMEGPLA